MNYKLQKSCDYCKVIDPYGMCEDFKPELHVTPRLVTFFMI